MTDNVSFLDLATLPEKDGRIETVTDFGLRLLTSRLPNDLASFPGFILKRTLNEQLKIIILGEPEGDVLALNATSIQTGIEVNVHTNLFKLSGDGLDDGYSDCSSREWIEQHPKRQPMILAHTTRLLGELGLYSGISV